MGRPKIPGACRTLIRNPTWEDYSHLIPANSSPRRIRSLWLQLLPSSFPLWPRIAGAASSRRRHQNQGPSRPKNTTDLGTSGVLVLRSFRSAPCYYWARTSPQPPNSARTGCTRPHAAVAAPLLSALRSLQLGAQCSARPRCCPNNIESRWVTSRIIKGTQSLPSLCLLSRACACSAPVATKRLLLSWTSRGALSQSPSHIPRVLPCISISAPSRRRPPTYYYDGVPSTQLPVSGDWRGTLCVFCLTLHPTETCLHSSLLCSASRPRGALLHRNAPNGCHVTSAKSETVIGLMAIISSSSITMADRTQANPSSWQPPHRCDVRADVSYGRRSGIQTINPRPVPSTSNQVVRDPRLRIHHQGLRHTWTRSRPSRQRLPRQKLHLVCLRQTSVSVAGIWVSG